LYELFRRVKKVEVQAGISISDNQITNSLNMEIDELKKKVDSLQEEKKY
jgi:FtsZ-binding cell division protein ZapB